VFQSNPRDSFKHFLPLISCECLFLSYSKIVNHCLTVNTARNENSSSGSDQYCTIHVPQFEITTSYSINVEILNLLFFFFFAVEIFKPEVYKQILRKNVNSLYFLSIILGV